MSFRTVSALDSLSYFPLKRKPFIKISQQQHTQKKNKKKKNNNNYYINKTANIP